MSEITRFNKKDPIVQGGDKSLDIQSATNFTTVSIPTGANYVVARALKADSTTNTAILRYTVDNSEPTSSSGFPIANMDILVFESSFWNRLKFISTDAETQQLWFMWYAT